MKQKYNQLGIMKKLFYSMITITIPMATQLVTVHYK